MLLAGQRHQPARHLGARRPRKAHAGGCYDAASVTEIPRWWRGAFVRAELWPLGLVLAAAAGIRMIWWSIGLPAFLNPDSLDYFLPAYDLVTGGQTRVPVRRTPGYSAFAAALFALSGASSFEPVLAAQHVMGVATAGLTYALGRLLFGRPTGLLAGLLAGLVGGLLLFEQTALTDAPAAFLLVLTCLPLVLGLARRHAASLFIGGLALGVLTLVRPSGQVLLIPSVVACALWGGSRRWRWIAVVVTGFALLVVPWMARNWVEYGSPRLVGSGRFLVHRALQDDNLFALWAASGHTTPSDPLRSAALRILVEEDRKKEPGSVTQRFRRELGLDEEGSDPIMWDLALQAIAANPTHYVQTTGLIAYQIVANRPLEVAAYWQPYREIGWPARLDYLLPAAPKDKNPFREAQVLAQLVDPGRFGPLLGALFIVGTAAAWRDPRTRLWLLPASMVLLSLLFTAAFGGLEWRFRFSHDPLLLLGAAFGLTSLTGAGFRWFRRQLNLAATRRAEARDSLISASGELRWRTLE